MLDLITGKINKPNRFEFSEFEKDVKYHIDYARWVIKHGYNQKQKDRLIQYQVNMMFYKNRQWINKEDLEAFFKDETNHDRNRIKVTRNFIQPMIEQYRGTADRMSFDVKASAISPMAKSRRERQLGRLLSYGDAARWLPEFGNYLKRTGYPVGQDEDETRNRFDNLYSDEFVISINRLMRYVKSVNNFDKYKKPLALDLAVGGIGILAPYPYNGEWMFRRVNPMQFGWDTGAQEQDLSDSDFFYEFDLSVPTNVYEQFQLDDMDKKRVEQYVSQATNKQATGTNYDVGHRVPVYTSVWRDTLRDTYGYVTDSFGQRILERIDYMPEGEDEPLFTMEDVVPVENLTPFQKKLLGNKSTKDMQVDVWRFCKFIPQEILAGSKSEPGRVTDIALDFGILPYQEPNLYMPTNMLPPYKCGTWSYIDGEVLSPTDVVINPQRMINRFLSVVEQHINSAGGSGMIFDKDFIGPEGEDNFILAAKRGDPIGVYAKGRGVNNAVGKYDSGIDKGTISLVELVENYRMGIEQITGVNEGLKGQTNNPDQLVGVMQLMIQRGSIIQEPFYGAIADIFRGCYQNIATSGKRYYIDHEAELVDAVGLESVEVLKLSKEMRWESHRVSLTRTVDPQTERLYVDQRTLMWLQYGLIDQETAAILMGRATDEEALRELRSFTKRLAEYKRKAQAAQADTVAAQEEAQQQMGQVMYGEQLRQEAREEASKDKDRATKMVVGAMKAGQEK